MRFISLFAGIGGFDLGLERAGWTCVAQVECEPFALEVLARHWPDVPRYTDVRSVSADSLPVCDAIVGGFPCQPHSVAGKQLGAADDRNLWPEFRRLVAEIRPRVVVGENVPGLDRTMLADVVRDLEALGYEVGVLGLAASTVGAPHRRERRFIVGKLADANRGRGDKDSISSELRADRPLESSSDSWSSDSSSLDEVKENVANGDGERLSRGVFRQRATQEGREKSGDGLASECSSGFVANPGDARLEGRNGSILRERASSFGTGTSGSSVGDAEGERVRAGLRDPEPNGLGRLEPSHASWRQTQPGLGNQPDGFPGGLAGPGPGGAWPSTPGPQAEWEAPRTEVEIDLRVSKLKALGNAIVPQVAELVGKAINKLL